MPKEACRLQPIYIIEPVIGTTGLPSLPSNISCFAVLKADSVMKIHHCPTPFSMASIICNIFFSSCQGFQSTCAFVLAQAMYLHGDDQVLQLLQHHSPLFQHFVIVRINLFNVVFHAIFLPLLYPCHKLQPDL